MEILGRDESFSSYCPPILKTRRGRHEQTYWALKRESVGFTVVDRGWYLHSNAGGVLRYIQSLIRQRALFLVLGFPWGTTCSTELVDQWRPSDGRKRGAGVGTP